MENKTESMRELFTLTGLGSIVRGTCHTVGPSGFESAVRQNTECSRVGIVFLNSLAPSRAAIGDGAVSWADLFGGLGYPSFRIDLPGFGDSDGDPPSDLQNFINTGGYGKSAAILVDEIVTRFGLAGAIIFGHCAGAVSATFSAAATANARGLILLSPYFHLPPQPARAGVRRRLTLWSSKSGLGKMVRVAYDGLSAVNRAVRQPLIISLARQFRNRYSHFWTNARLTGTKRLPANANIPMLRCWQKIARRGVPVLILTEPHRSGLGIGIQEEFDYLEHALKLAGRMGKVHIQEADGADHSFANAAGRRAVAQLSEEWLLRSFPLDVRPRRRPNEISCELDSISECFEDTRDLHASKCT